MIDILQLVPLRPEVQTELAARYRLHGRSDFDKVADIVRGCVTNGHSGPPPEMIDRMPKLEIIASASVAMTAFRWSMRAPRAFRSPTRRMC